MSKYPSFVNEPAPQPDYDCRELKASDFVLKARCNKNNPDCQQYIEDERNENYDVKIVGLDTDKHGKDMIDVWVRRKNLFRKIA